MEKIKWKNIRNWFKDDYNLFGFGLWILGVGASLAICAEVYQVHEDKKQKTLIQKSKVIIPNITRDNYIDKKEISDVLNLTDSYINKYNKTKIKITSRPDLNANGIISRIERNVLYNKIDSVITSYNAKNKTVAHRNNAKSNLYTLIHSPTKDYSSKNKK